MMVAAFVLATAGFSTQAAVIKATQCVTADAKDITGGGSVVSDECVGVLAGDSGGEINYDASDMNTAKPGSVHTSTAATPWTPGAFGRVGWVQEAKVEGPGAGNLGFQVDSVVGTLLTWSTTTALNGTWVVKVKQAKEIVLYLFENLQETTSGTVELGKFANPGWSNIALVSGPQKQVPVPASFGLMSLGLASMLWMRRRRESAARSSA